MSRSSNQKVVEVEEVKTLREIVDCGGANQKIFENDSEHDDPSREQVVLQLEMMKETAIIGDEEGDNENEVEKRQLLAVENAPPLDLQVISATCQSISTEDKLGSSSPSSSLRKGDADNDEKKEENGYFDEGGFFFNNYRMNMERKSSVPNAFLTLILVLFNLLWSVGLTYWQIQLNNFGVAVASLMIIVVSGSITSIAFFTGKNRTGSKSSLTSPCARQELWKCSKVAWLLAAVPCLAPVILAVAYFISSLLDKRAQWSSSNNSSDGSTTIIASGGSEQRQCAKSNATTTSSSCTSTFRASRWLAASGSFFLLESLSLCFPFSVLHLVVLMESPNSIPSFIGFYTLLGLFVLSFSITFSRFQFDCLNKPDRFGEGTESYLRFAYLWSAKIIWLVTFAIITVTVRVLYPDREIEATAAAVAGFIAIHEIPLWICLVPRCGKLAAKLSGLFFLIPQFTSLIALIYWVNTDPHIYHTNIGSIMLGLYFWSETIMLCGWLVDGNADKDIDLVPLYPHFFGDLIASCFSTEENVPIIA